MLQRRIPSLQRMSQAGLHRLNGSDATSGVFTDRADMIVSCSNN